MFSCPSSGSSRLLLPGCVKNSITPPGPQLGTVAVIKPHPSVSQRACVSPFHSLSLSSIHTFSLLSASTSVTFPQRDSFVSFFYTRTQICHCWAFSSLLLLRAVMQPWMRRDGSDSRSSDGFSDGLSAVEPISVLVVVTKAGSDRRKLPLTNHRRRW